MSLSTAFLPLTLFALSVIALPSSTAHATTITPNTTDDVVNATDGKCSLREAIIAANTNSFSGTASGECPAGGASVVDQIILQDTTYPLTLQGEDDTAAAGDLDITQRLTILGVADGKTTIAGNTTDRLFDILSPLWAVIMQNLFLTNGGGVSEGGAIRLVSGDLFLSRCTLFQNWAIDSGGAIHNTGGDLWIDRSAIVGNGQSAPDAEGTMQTVAIGGGITSRGSSYIANTTIAQNTAMQTGGGLQNMGASISRGKCLHCTIARNVAGDAGSGIYNTTGGQFWLAHTIMMENLPDTVAECSGTVQSHGYNLARTAATPGCLVPTTGILMKGDITATTAGLGELTDQSVAGNAHFPLLGNSPAVQSGRACPVDHAGEGCQGAIASSLGIKIEFRIDQRGTHRAPSGWDIGAIEAICGDAIVHPAQSEACDDGNVTDGDGCSSACVVETTNVADQDPTVPEPTAPHPVVQEPSAPAPETGPTAAPPPETETTGSTTGNTATADGTQTTAAPATGSSGCSLLIN